MGEFGGSSGKLRNGKMYTFEGGMRVPTLAMYEGYIPAGTETNQIISQLDWFPTFASITNSEFSDKIILDGEDISDLLKGESNNNERDFLYFDYDKLEG